MRCHNARSSAICVFESRVSLLMESLAGCTTRQRPLARKKAHTLVRARATRCQWPRVALAVRAPA